MKRGAASQSLNAFGRQVSIVASEKSTKKGTFQPDRGELVALMWVEGRSAFTHRSSG